MDAAPPAARARGWTGWIVAALVLVALAGGGYWYLGRKQAAAEASRSQAVSEAQNKGVPVKAVEVRAVDLPLYIEGLGTVQALNTVTIRSRVDGELVKIAFQEGQIVQQGDILAEIDPRPYQAALDQALAKKAQDEATLVNNRRDLERTTQLGEFATQQQRDTQSAAISSQGALIKYDQATIDNARTQLGYATIRAPLSGRTGLRLVDQGNIVRAADTTGIVEIAQIQPIAVLFTAPQQQLPDISAALKRGTVPVTALSSDGSTVLDQGELTLINNSIDAGSGTIRLKAAFPNTGEKLWPGLSVDTRLLVKTLPQALVVPSDAVQRGPNGLFAYVVGPDNKAEKRDLKVGVFSEGQAVIEDGLKAGDRVVVSGQYRLNAGTKVDAGTADGQSHLAATPAVVRK